MVSLRCRMQVKALIESKGYSCDSIDAGEFELLEDLSNDALIELGKALNSIGFLILNGKEEHVFKTIRGIVAELIHYSEAVLQIDIDEYLNKKMKMSAADLILLFSSVKGISIAQYFMLQKIEKAKELILYEGMPVLDIASKLGFNSLAEMQNDFKKLSGLSPDFFENLRLQRLEKMKLCE
jgi:AraC-like DNA-binding protein